MLGDGGERREGEEGRRGGEETTSFWRLSWAGVGRWISFSLPLTLSLFPSGEKVDGAPFGVVCCTRKFFSVYHKGRKKKTEKEEEG
jgi:hypothetical protein